MDLAHLASKLADALVDIVPPQIDVDEIDGMVMFSGGEHRVAVEVADVVDEPGDDIEHVQTVINELLSTMQCYISSSLGNPWPSRGASSVRPNSDVSETAIRMWFEDESGIRVLEVPSISW